MYVYIMVHLCLREDVCVRETAANVPVQVFFEWQKRGGWAAIGGTTEGRMLMQLIQAAADRYLRAIHLPPVHTDTERERERDKGKHSDTRKR
jgi:hypothetical protein